MALRLLDRLSRRAASAGDATAVRLVLPACRASVTVDYGQLHAAASALAEELRALAAPTETVLLSARNRPEFAVAYLATLAADLTVFPVHPALAPPELAAAAERAAARVLIGEAAPRAALADRGLACIDIEGLLERGGARRGLDGGERSAMLLHSSGTTGRPRIVRRSAASLDAVAANIVRALDLRPEDRVLSTIPLCHSYGVEHGLLAPLFAGAEVHVGDGFDPATVCGQLTGAGITVFPGVPFMFQVLAERGATLPTIRRLISAGGPLPAPVAEAFARATGRRIGQLYGSTEVGSITFIDGDDLPAGAAGCVGAPMRGVQLRILDPDDPDPAAPRSVGAEGHVAVAAPSMLESYVGEPTSPFVDGWFLTGDLGRLDEAGRLWITGRLKLQIDVGGLKVNPLEIEAVLREHPAVRECVVVPMAVADTVDRLRAIVVPAPGGPAVVAETLRSWVRGRLAPHKVPRVIEFRDDLPRTAAGKVRREAVRCG